MTTEQLVNQHILEYESRLKHVAELYARAQKATDHLDEDHQSKSELKALSDSKLKMEQQATGIRTMSTEDWRKETIKNAGPMAIWDILAQQLEKFVERHE
jgi:hypothetical protein